jgi:hemerythrin
VTIIQWDHSLSVNVAEIDQQHQKLIKIINELYDAMRQGKGKEVIGKTINGLIEYAGEHFQTEEKYFDLFGYPETSSHKKEHADFVKKVTGFKSELETGRLSLSLEVMNFLSDWLKNHIKGVDMKYSPFFNEKGLK